MSIIEKIEDLKVACSDQTLASQALASEVAGKVTAINQALAQAVEVAPKLKRTFYVDVNGSDQNDGSKGSPFKTTMRAISLIPESGVGIIYLNAGTHEFSEEVTANENITIFIFPSQGGTELNTELKFVESRVVSDYAYVCTLWLTGGYFYANNIKISTGLRSDNSITLSPYAAIQARYGCFVTFGSGSVDVGDYNLIANAHSWSAQADFSSVSFCYLSSINKSGVGSLYYFEGFATLYSVMSVLDGATWSDLVKGNLAHLFNNVGLA
ncbi:DUF1565 domain-containing protein [Pseudoalteromonas sp. MMG013]|uniref:DUF1565 domain-containing protein n=1 Tax=Pseudoalteromonas sp. MMG013 TaxID=2822687 RepID=UPI001B364AD0|nr:DUF1565 domain-containing protein [Pseudoalteromonas sp. MMG013]MBQ4864599.1 DUF1565 domain-containing protein [Pseudoalteromonas sp. MMG013]